MESLAASTCRHEQYFPPQCHSKRADTADRDAIQELFSHLSHKQRKFHTTKHEDVHVMGQNFRDLLKTFFQDDDGKELSTITFKAHAEAGTA